MGTAAKKKMLIKNSIKQRLIAWFLISVIIFSGTMLILYVHVRQIVKIPERIVSKNLEIASGAKKMVEDLLGMEEYGKKFSILEKDEYKGLFVEAARGYKSNLDAILGLEADGYEINGPWKELHSEFNRINPLGGGFDGTGSDSEGGIPVSVIDDWIQKITDGIAVNEQEIISASG